MNNLNFDIVIVGLGPTGGTLANLLAMNNVSVLILEKEENIYNLPRAVHFDDEIMRVFQTIGITKSLSKKLIINKIKKLIKKEKSYSFSSFNSFKDFIIISQPIVISWSEIERGGEILRALDSNNKKNKISPFSIHL